MAKHGFCRRLETLKRCIENIYETCPPDQTERLSEKQLSDLVISLQSFMFNCYGCLDNLAWIWAKEKEIKQSKGKDLNPTQIGLLGKNKNGEYKFIELRKTLPENFINELSKYDDWFDKYLTDFRHALAHRIPPYIPPAQLTNEEIIEIDKLENERMQASIQGNHNKSEEINQKQKSIGRFCPLMTHSYIEESKPIYFHAQIICDWKTIVEISKKFLEALDATESD